MCTLNRKNSLSKISQYNRLRKKIFKEPLIKTLAKNHSAMMITLGNSVFSGSFCFPFSSPFSHSYPFVTPPSSVSFCLLSALLLFLFFFLFLFLSSSSSFYFTQSSGPINMKRRGSLSSYYCSHLCCINHDS